MGRSSGWMTEEPTLFAQQGRELLQLMEPDEFKQITSAKSEEEIERALQSLRALVDL